MYDSGNNEASTQAIRELIQLVMDAPEWIGGIVPIRDGLLVAYKQA